MITAEAADLILRAKASGKTAPQLVYEIAQARGYQPPMNAQRLASMSNAQFRAYAPNARAPAGAFNPQRLARMSEGEFERCSTPPPTCAKFWGIKDGNTEKAELAARAAALR
jgi:hypothetical protein